MDPVRRSLEGGSRSRKARAGRFTLVVVVILLTWLIVAWIISHNAIGS
ncbi:MAG TPA: hypothetical protein VF310_03935 [Vicinamibacteria bacterium]